MRIPQPCFRKQTQTSYVRLEEKQHMFGPDKQEALTKYKALLAGEQVGEQGEQGEGMWVIAVRKLFKDWSEQHESRAPPNVLKRH